MVRGQTEYMPVSRFVKEIPQSLLDGKINSTSHSTSPAKAFALYGKTVPCRQKSGSKSFKADYGYYLPPFSYRAGPALPRKRKILIISLQSQPTLVGRTHNTETIVIVAVVRVVVVPVRNLAVVIVVIPGTTALYAVRTRRRAGLYLFIRT